MMGEILPDLFRKCQEMFGENIPIAEPIRDSGKRIPISAPAANPL